MVSPVKLFKAWMWLNDVQRAALKEVVMENQVKAGWKTTEFWLTMATQVPVVLGIFLGVTNPITIAVGAAATIAYTLGRAWSKSNGAAVALAALEAAAKKSQELQVAPPAAPPK